MSAIAGSLPIVVGSCLIAFFLAGIYRGQWRLIGVSDLHSYALGVLLGVAVSLATVTLITRFDSGHSRSAYIIFGALVFLAIVGSRLSFRLFDSILLSRAIEGRDGQRTRLLIYGAGKGGKLLYEEVHSNPEMKEYVLAGFIDDDQDRVGSKLCSLPVKSAEEWLRQSWASPPVIWISSRSIPDQLAQELAQRWHQPVQVRRLTLRMEPIGDTVERKAFLPEEISPSPKFREDLPSLVNILPDVALSGSSPMVGAPADKGRTL